MNNAIHLAVLLHSLLNMKVLLSYTRKYVALGGFRWGQSRLLHQWGADRVPCQIWKKWESVRKSNATRTNLPRGGGMVLIQFRPEKMYWPPPSATVISVYYIGYPRTYEPSDLRTLGPTNPRKIGTSGFYRKTSITFHKSANLFGLRRIKEIKIKRKPRFIVIMSAHRRTE